MLSLKNVTLRRGSKVVLTGASVTLQAGEKIGLVGNNGAGKSSLFSLLTQRLQSDSGDVQVPPHWRMTEVAQEMPETDLSATDFTLEGDTRLNQAQQELEQAQNDEDGHAMAEAYQKVMDAGGLDARARAQALLMGLGFKKEQLDTAVNHFSGGWRMRLQLARALMCPADLMLLDEPTNHLDLDALVWLEAWLKRFTGTILVISHDREFLDAVTQVTLHLDQTQLIRYGGNYSTFEEMRAERLQQAQVNYTRQQDRIAHLKQFIDRFKAKASKAKQAQSRVKALARMEKLGPVLTQNDFQFEFKPPAGLPNPMLALSQVSCGYKEAPILQGINCSVLAGQRIGILGANGQGKSTLVKTIARLLPPLHGELTEGKGLVIGYFAQQELDILQLEDGPLMHMIRLARDIGPAGREQELRDFLGSFRFTSDMVNQPVGTLSGGEKARLVLAMLVWQRPHLLLLDEPTNHLDLNTREALSIALNTFEGTVLLVSHDRALLREVCDEFWLISKGRLSPFDGDLDDYQRWLQEQAKEAAKAAKAGSSSMANSSSRDGRKAATQARLQGTEQLRPLQQRVTLMEKEIPTLESQKKSAAEEMSRSDCSPERMAELGKQFKNLEQQLTTLENEWLETQSKIENLTRN
jgi:ATP-binding cassette, subfamily F, member 3